MRTKLILPAIFASIAFAFAACSSDDPKVAVPVDSGITTDTGIGSNDSGIPVDTGVVIEDTGADTKVATDSGDAGPSALCNQYCDQLAANCKGANAQYADRPACLTACATFTVGTAGATTGNTLQCRIYHSGAPSAATPATHCPHSGKTPTAQCI